jgi:hypothetical protein
MRDVSCPMRDVLRSMGYMVCNAMGNIGGATRDMVRLCLERRMLVAELRQLAIVPRVGMTSTPIVTVFRVRRQGVESKKDCRDTK